MNITFAPPALPVYVQPPLPESDTSGRRATGRTGRTATTGCLAPGRCRPSRVCFGPLAGGVENNGVYVFNEGYWGPTVGFYGGIDYGYGYGGDGYQGGYWNRGAFFYNRAGNNFGNVHITNVYNRTIINNTTTHVSFNGGQGGIIARPTPQQLTYEHVRHTPPTGLQTQHQQAASSNHDLLASVNHGRPAIAATSRPAAFTGAGVVGARAAGGPYHPAPAGAAHGVRDRR